MVWPIGFTCRWLGNLHQLKGLPPLPDALLTTALPPFIPPVLSIPSRDIGWIAVSRCFKAHFALRRLLWKWIREHIPWEKSIFPSAVEMGRRLKWMVHSGIKARRLFFVQQKKKKSHQVISSHAENPRARAHTHTQRWGCGVLLHYGENYEATLEFISGAGSIVGPNAEEKTPISPDRSYPHITLSGCSHQTSSSQPENLPLENQLRFNSHRRTKHCLFYLFPFAPLCLKTA